MRSYRAVQGWGVYRCRARRPEPIKALSDRQNEISEPLLAIASVCGLEDELRHALSMAFAGDNAQTPKQALLARIRMRSAISRASSLRSW